MGYYSYCPSVAVKRKVEEDLVWTASLECATSQYNYTTMLTTMWFHHSRISMIVFGHQNISFKGNWLFTSPKDSFSAPLTLDLQAPIASHNSNPAISPQGAYGSLRNRRESLGTVEQGTGRAGNRITSNQRATISRSRNTNKSHNFKAVPVSSNLNSDYSTDEEEREQL